MRTRGPFLRALILTAVAALVTSAANAQIEVSPDVTLPLGTTTANDEDVMLNDAGTFSQIFPVTIPANADVVAYERDGDDYLISLDTAVELFPGGVIVEPRDVARFDTSAFSFSLEFDGASEGVPAGAHIDALALDGADLLLSFDVTVNLPGASGVPDEAIVSFDGVSFSVLFDGTPLGTRADPLDTDGLSRSAGGNLLLSFNGSGVLGGVNFDDEDVLEYDAGGGTWALSYDGSAADPDWAAGDLVAVPEPGSLISLLAGGALLSAFAANKSSRKRAGGISCSR